MIKQVKLVNFKKYKDQTLSIKADGLSLLIGGNNSGKSTLVQALSIWEFCRIVLQHEKGDSVFLKANVGRGEGFGMSSEEFLPLALPSLNHLWFNLKTQLSEKEKKQWGKNAGYCLRIKCLWDSETRKDLFLEFGLALANDRLFIRVTESNLLGDEKIPRIIYLPTFTGIQPSETKATVAERRAYLGRGMAGSILRNMIYDLYVRDGVVARDLKGDKSRLRGADKELYLATSPLCRLNANLRKTFNTELEIEDFSEDFHRIIKVYERKGYWEGEEFKVLPKKTYPLRDIVGQGSGFLQWLSIFCILLNNEVDVLLLDEPDAHLHASLQTQLLNEINSEAARNKVQILLATHSVEMIKAAQLEDIYNMDTRKYIENESTRAAALSGIGSEYFPYHEKLNRNKKVVFLENESDKNILEILAAIIGTSIPENVVFWYTTAGNQDRKMLFEELRKDIPDLRGLSLRDRDMEERNTVAGDLKLKGFKLTQDYPLKMLMWRRKNIESYLLCPNAISRVANVDVKQVKDFFAEKHSLAIDNDGCTISEAPSTIMLCDGKEIFTVGENSLKKKFHCDKYSVARAMTPESVCEDVKIVLLALNSL